MRRCLRCEHAHDQPDWRCPHCGHEPARVGGIAAFAPELAHASDGFDAAMFAELARLEAGYFWFRARNRLILWALQRFFPTTRSLLEVGCGTGFVLAGLASARPDIALTGSELAADGLAFAAQRVPHACLLQMDARHIPFRDAFDVIGAFDVLEHIDDDAAVLRALFDAVRPGGGLLLTVPQHRWLWSQVDVEAHHVRRYRAAELRAKVREAGFEVIHATSFVALLLPLMLASRVAQRGPAHDRDPLGEFKLAPWLNAALEGILRLEQVAIRAGLPLPFGGSLLLVARRPAPG